MGTLLTVIGLLGLVILLAIPISWVAALVSICWKGHIDECAVGSATFAISVFLFTLGCILLI